MGIPVTFADILAIGPISLIFVTALILLVVESILPNGEKVDRWIALIGFLVAGAVAAANTAWSGLAFGGTVTTGGFANYTSMVFCVGGALSVLLSSRYLRKIGTVKGEFHALVAIAVLGIFLNRKNVIVLLMAIELMLLAVNMNFIAFSHYLGDIHGQIFVFFILTVAAAESAIGLAILVVLFRNLHTINVDDLDHLKG